MGISAAHASPARPVPHATEEPTSLDDLHQNIRENCSHFEEKEEEENGEVVVAHTGTTIHGEFKREAHDIGKR